MKLISLCAFLGAILQTSLCLAEEVKVAVAANFYKPMIALIKVYEKTSADKIILSAGSTGSLYAQIKHGAPFDVFLAADQRRPLALAKEGLAQQKSQFTYAQGQLALWSLNPDILNNTSEILHTGIHSRIAVANPKTAPYGAAAAEVLKAQGLYSKLQDTLVQGNNIAQTYQYVSSGTIPLGFVALSQVFKDGKISSGSAWIVPSSLHKPIKQDVILLNKGEINPAAKRMMAYLQSPAAHKIIQSYGYNI